MKVLSRWVETLESFTVAGKGNRSRARWIWAVDDLLRQVRLTYGEEAFATCYAHSKHCALHSVSPRKCVLYGLCEWMEAQGYFVRLAGNPTLVDGITYQDYVEGMLK